MEKFKIPKKTINKVMNLLESSPANYSLCQISMSTIRALQSIPRELIPDMPDRIVAATAIELGLPLISKDTLIRNANLLEVIW